MKALRLLKSIAVPKALCRCPAASSRSRSLARVATHSTASHSHVNACMHACMMLALVGGLAVRPTHSPAKLVGGIPGRSWWLTSSIWRPTCNSTERVGLATVAARQVNTRLTHPSVRLRTNSYGQGEILQVLGHI
jgi:hypothetical protein